MVNIHSNRASIRFESRHHERACFLTCSEEKVVRLTLTAIANYAPSNFWSLTLNNPDLIRLLVNAGIRVGVPWLQGTSDITCPLCQVESEDNFNFMSSCNIIRSEWTSFGKKLLSIAEVN